MIRLRSTFSFILIGVAFASGRPVQGQSSAEPYSTIDVRVSGAAQMKSSTQLELWTTDYAGSLSLSTPFYAGHLQTGVRIQPFEAVSSSQASFWSGFLFLGWAGRVKITSWFHAETGARVGNFFMSFDEDDVDGIRNESELAAGLVQSIHIVASERIGLFFEGSYTRVFTSTRLHLNHFSAGLTYRLQTPEWLKTVIQ